MKSWMTAAAFQSLGISRQYERLNRLVIGVATMVADSFRNRGSRLSRLIIIILFVPWFYNITLSLPTSQIVKIAHSFLCLINVLYSVCVCGRLTTIM